MNKLFVSALCIITLALCGCKQATESTESQENKNKAEKIVDVEGRKNFGNSYALITPQPAIMIATYDANGVPDVMMAAWGGQRSYQEIEFNLGSHKTTDNILLKKAFCVSFADERTLKESDYFGIVSGNDVPDKVACAGFTAVKSPNVDAPIIQEYLLTLECTLVSIDDFGHVIGKVVNVSADESVLNAEGKVDLGKLKPVIFDASSLSYRSVGDTIARAWGIGQSLVDK